MAKSIKIEGSIKNPYKPLTQKQINAAKKKTDSKKKKK